ncbi:E3 ubiquitin-protein ligase listerin isoform X1 [Neodiprion lecontei]|uniref:E3 ubiquitin-protein ligase listerin n=2 Tax=Neodiprion lecontei TaxID=441921 RepID=A0ABM3G9N8_NEOLC|nr:E3 ubiquitin-protein ligase listerin isoform X1 [Neodiprion lecontei]
MGKNKQAQRTKNNARPSSSGRSAELLEASMPNFVGFSGAKDGGYIPLLPRLTISTLDEIDMSKLDSHFQLLLKKMNKKDGTTKLKALQEFTELCNNSTAKTILAVLPFWPRIYCLLAIDVEHRVREAAHVAHLAIVKPAGRNIAPYLKQLAGPWFTSQYDTYAPAASAATNAFQQTFPPNKLADAIAHCQEEILTYICDNITNQTPQTLGNNKTVTPEEMDMRYQRLLISSLQGYSLYLKTISPQQIEKVAKIHDKILSHNKFWKLVKHEIPLVRAGFFNVLASMIQHAEELYKNEKKKLITTIMNNLDETDPGVLPVVWEAVLLAICKIEGWHTVVSIEKLIIPKLWHVLREGGNGSANAIYPNLLPFISHFPIQNENKMNFYTNFFNNLRKGFKVKSVQLSYSEMLAVVTAFVECLRYVILLNNEDEILCETLLKQQLMPTLEWCLVEISPVKPLIFKQISQLIRYWSKNRSVADYKSYGHLVQQFWSTLEETLLNLIHSTEANFDSVHISNLYDSLLDLFLSLKNTTLETRKNLRVKFFDSNDRAEKSDEVLPKVPEEDLKYCTELAQLINKITSVHFDNINKDSSESAVMLTCYKLITNFESKDLFIALTKSCGKDTSFLDFYNKTLRKWLIEKPEQTELLIMLLFSLIKYLDKLDKKTVLASLSELQNENKIILRHAVKCALFKHNRKDPAVKEWFSQAEVSSVLLDVTKQVAVNETTIDLDVNKKILMQCFECSDNTDLIISDSTFDDIVSILCKGLNEQSQDNLNSLVELVSEISSATWTHNKLRLGVVKIIETMFGLSCTLDLDSSAFPIRKTVQNTWKNGLVQLKTMLSPAKLVDLTKKCADILWANIFLSEHLYSLEKLVEIAVSFIKALVEDDDENEHTKNVISAFTAGSKMATWLADVTTIVLYAEVVSGNLATMETCFQTKIGQDIVKIDLEQKYPTDNIENCVRWALLNIKLLKKLFMKKSEGQDDIEDDSTEVQDMDIVKVNALPVIEETMLNILHIVATGYLYGLHYTSTKHFNGISTLFTDLKEEVKVTYTLLGTDIRESNLKFILQNSGVYVGIWPHVLRLFCMELAPCDSLTTKFREDFSITSSASNNVNEIGAQLQAVQVLSDYLNMEDIPLQLDNNVNALVVGRSLLGGDSEKTLTYFIATLDKVIKLYQEDNGFLLFDCDVSEVTWQQFTLPLEVVRFLSKSVSTIPTKLTHAHWDFILISLASWQLSVKKSKKNCGNLKVTAFIVAVNKLFCTLQELLYKHEKESVEGLPGTILDEWKNIFADDVYIVLVETWMYCSDLYNQHDVSSMQLVLLNNLGEALKLVDEKIFFGQHTSAAFESINSEKVIKLSFNLLQSPVPSLQLSAYQVFKKIIPELVARDKNLIESESFDLNLLNFKKFENVLASTQYIVNAMLLDFKLCETVSCTIQPYTDSYTYTLGYLFEWAILLDMCSYAHAELRYQYSELLKDDFFPSLMNNLFRLMPVEIFQDNKNKAVRLTEIFSTAPSFSFAKTWTECRLDHLVCWLYANSLRQLPVLVRQWWGAADSRVSAAVERITILYVSPMLCQEELSCNKLTGIENMQVKVHPTAREVIALYQVEDAKLELSIILPINHPLGPVTVDLGQHAGGAANWRNCHMQLSIFLTHQNGSIWDGLTLWKNNLDKRFAGVEECYICFSIVHATTNQIPKLSCHTCRKKFHTPCLYKWFSTSQKSTCPICRNIF